MGPRHASTRSRANEVEQFNTGSVLRMKPRVARVRREAAVRCNRGGKSGTDRDLRGTIRASHE